MQKRQNLALAAIRKIRCVKQRKCSGRQQPSLFASAGGGLHERRGIPFREVNPVPADFEPALQEIELSAFS
jgi:hypothetical protein